MIRLNLSAGISTNRLFSHTSKHRFKSKAYAKWQEVAGWELVRQRNEQKIKQIKGFYALALQIPLARTKAGIITKKHGDIDNYIKAISDLLVIHKITPDDIYMRIVQARFYEAEKVDIIINPILESDFPAAGIDWGECNNHQDGEVTVY